MREKISNMAARANKSDTLRFVSSVARAYLCYFNDIRTFTGKSISQCRHTLSEAEARVLSSLSYRGKTIFTIEDAKEFAGNPKNLLDWLLRKKWILKTTKAATSKSSQTLRDLVRQETVKS
jgi:hypothetical protein